MTKLILMSKQSGIQQLRRKYAQLRNWFLLWDGPVTASEIQRNQNLILMRMLPTRHRILVSVLLMKDSKIFFGIYKSRIQRTLGLKHKFMIQSFSKSVLAERILLKKLEKCAFVQYQLRIARA